MIWVWISLLFWSGGGSFPVAITKIGRRNDATDGRGSKHGIPILKFNGAIVLMMDVAAFRLDQQVRDNGMAFMIRRRFALGLGVEGDRGLRGEAFCLLRRG